MSTNSEAGERMTLPRAISDAIESYRTESGNLTLALWTNSEAVSWMRGRTQEARAALERAIADHVSPVDAPTEAEIEAWKKSVDSGRKSLHAYVIGRPEIEQAVALMRRAAAAKQGGQ